MTCCEASNPRAPDGSARNPVPLRIAVLMASHNRRAITLRCLTDLAQQVLPESVTLQVYLVDDGSTDGTGEVVRQQFPAVRIIAGDGTLFWCNAMRRAWDVAASTQPNAYLWLNDDVVLVSDAIQTLVQTWQTAETDMEPPVIVVGSCQDPATGALTYGGQRRMGHHPGRVTLIPPSDQPQACDTFNGNIVLVSSRVYERVGNMRYFHHAMGDTDYGYRALQAGCRLVLAPGFLGACDANQKEDIKNRRDLTKSERLNILKKRLPPDDWWRLLVAHAGWRALIYWPGPYLRVLLQ
jgi:GT2 family glycosyltransferase